MTPNFGQVMPLLLLLLPMLSALEISADMKELREIPDSGPRQQPGNESADDSLANGHSSERGTLKSISSIISSFCSTSTGDSDEPRAFGARSNTAIIEAGLAQSLPMVFSDEFKSELGIDINVFGIAMRRKICCYAALLWIGLLFVVSQFAAIITAGIDTKLSDIRLQSFPVGKLATIGFSLLAVAVVPAQIFMSYVLPTFQSRRILKRERIIAADQTTAIPNAQNAPGGETGLWIFSRQRKHG
ncbi:Uu.00g091410.m01.CDS01 [Anthostomella pinea]|uniref:Uu.00g091410.m01.CDS01 n=1 Tax=Anthostomella pinea TaxID=933095 RepID=A0AAI8VN30_9PEZI|nr:Uu.00g091410.m01.CDS01 [Anthostomella pinea]